MKKILLVGMISLLSMNVSAQMLDSDFAPVNPSVEQPASMQQPMDFSIPQPSPAVQARIDSQQNVPDNQNAPGNQNVAENSSQGQGLFPELAANTPSSPNTEQQSKEIELIIDNVSIVNPPLNGISFCVATLTAKNGLNVTIEALDLMLRYGTLDVPVSFAGLTAQGGEQTQQLGWAGVNCNKMLDVPNIKVVKCVAPSMSAAACQEKINYLPLQ